MTYENIIFETEGKIAFVTINRPQSLNALNAKTISELSAVLDEISTDSNIRVAIITGSGEKSFVAGADIKEFSDFGKEAAEQLARNGQNILFDKIENLNKVINEINKCIVLCANCHRKLHN